MSGGKDVLIIDNGSAAEVICRIFLVLHPERHQPREFIESRVFTCATRFWMKARSNKTLIPPTILSDVLRLFFDFFLFFLILCLRPQCLGCGTEDSPMASLSAPLAKKLVPSLRCLSRVEPYLRSINSDGLLIVSYLSSYLGRGLRFDIFDFGLEY